MNLTRLKTLLASHGVDHLFLKRLAPNDNSKNQVYFGPGFSAINIIPNGGIRAEASGARIIMKAHVPLLWMNDEGQLVDAPGAQMILYPQYPEVRFSGYLKGCRPAPSKIMSSRDPGRILFLGITRDQKVIGYATAADTDVVRELDALGELALNGVFNELPLGEERPENARAELLAELRRIHLKGWIDSKRIGRSGVPEAYRAPNGGGYTLETELGISPNGFAEPDFRGWEVKYHGVNSFAKPEGGSPVTLMTPEPTGGIYRDAGVEIFIRRFGYPDRKGRPDRLNVGGIFIAGRRAPLTGLTLVLDGYDYEAGMITDASKGITLLSDDDEFAAVWHYPGLMEHWKRKHNRAAYVPGESRKEPARQYRYGNRIMLGEETDFLMFLAAMAAGHVFYDPGIKMEGVSLPKPESKRRSQFRVKWKDLPSLYRTTSEFDVMAEGQ